MKRALTFIGVVFAAPAFAGGFAISEQDAASTGRGGTGFSVSGEAAALYRNPAGLMGRAGLMGSLGVTGILPLASATNPTTSETINAASTLTPVPHAYVGYGFGDLALGVGFNAPFGGGLSWPETWYGRMELVDMRLQVIAAYAGGAWRINEYVSVGLSASLYSASVALNKRIDFIDSEGKAQLGGGGMGVAGQLGVIVHPTPDVNVGLSARIPSTIALKGRAHFEDVPGAFASTLPDQAISTSLTLPARIAFGIDAMVEPITTRFFFDAEVTFWTSFKSFAIDFENPSTPDVTSPRDWRIAPTFRLGAERDFGFALCRLGLGLDLAASPTGTLSPSLPDSTRVAVSAGVGRAFGLFRADLSYLFVYFLPVAATGEALPAQYRSMAHLFALSLAWVGDAEPPAPVMEAHPPPMPVEGPMPATPAEPAAPKN